MSNDSTPDASHEAADDLTNDRSPAPEAAGDAPPAKKKRTSKRTSKRKTTRKKVAASASSTVKAPRKRSSRKKTATAAGDPAEPAVADDATASDPAASDAAETEAPAVLVADAVSDETAAAIGTTDEAEATGDHAWSAPAGGGEADRPESAGRGRRRGRGRAEAADDVAAEPVADDDADSDADADETMDRAAGADGDGESEDGKKPRRKRRRRKKSGRGSGEDEVGDGRTVVAESGDAAAEASDEDEDDRRPRRASDEDDVDDADDAEGPAGDQGGSRSKSREPRKKSSSRSRGRESEIQSQIVEPLGDEMMIINDLAEDECRIAVLEEGHLEEIFVERESTATNVGNIYKGRVVNIEPAIQAAFVDYGQGANGFLHISDLHPKYFPGEGATEKVGKKTPRRERPSIQQALKRGQEILVQVLKEGIGTKGPTLTSYLSIPGRLLVMMPDMDRVGVSRKVDDDDSRREMRKILDDLDLPDGFGFILRTAGMGRTKTEIKRDVAYLTRLWKQMEKRIDKVGAPCPLYTESDLVIRTVRDVLRPSIKSIVVDSQSAYDRVSAFLRVVAPRSSPRVVRYARPTPIFHAFGVERQIDLIHAREVPLPSGGALVIDQTEALLAIDVNSGKSRAARDSETNAYRTNCEAVDEIARQLRLRDLGGLVVNDLIDMRHARHRKAIEDRFRENLKRDRARTSISRISEFGLVEMTRQRMRPSLRKGQYAPCPTCQGRGEVQAPDSLGAEVIRHVALFLDQPRVARLEVVCSPRVSSVLLSRKRRELVHLEDHTGKQVDVRVSDDIPVDRVDYYAYDDRNADLDLQMFQPRKAPKLDDLEREAAQIVDDFDDDGDDAGDETGGRRRRRRRRKPGPADATAIALSEGLEEELAAIDEEEAQEERDAAAAAARPDRGEAEGRDRGPADESEDEDGEGGRKRRRRRRRRRRKGGEGEGDGEAEGDRGGESAEDRDGGDRDRTPAETAPSAPAPAPVAAEPMKVFELAKELDVKSRVILDAAAELDIEVTSHMNRLDADAVRRLREKLAPPAAPEATSARDDRGVDEARDTDGSRDDRSARDDRDARGDRDADQRDDEREDDGEEGGGRKRRRRRRRRRRKGGDGEGGEGGEDRGPSGGEARGGDGDGDGDRDRDRDRARERDGDGGGGGGKSRGEEGRRRRQAAPVTAADAPDATRGDDAGPKAGGGATTTEPKPRRRPLYGSRKRVPRAAVVESQDPAP